MTRDDVAQDFLARSDRVLHRTARRGALVHAAIPLAVAVVGLAVVPASGIHLTALGVNGGRVVLLGSGWLVFGWIAFWTATAYFCWGAAEGREASLVAAKGHSDQLAVMLVDAAFDFMPEELTVTGPPDLKLLQTWLSNARLYMRERLRERVPSRLLGVYLAGQQAALECSLGLQSDVGRGADMVTDPLDGLIAERRAELPDGDTPPE